METQLYKIGYAKYLKNPDKWDVRVIGWYSNGKPFALCYKRK